MDAALLYFHPYLCFLILSYRSPILLNRLPIERFSGSGWFLGKGSYFPTLFLLIHFSSMNHSGRVSHSSFAGPKEECKKKVLELLTVRRAPKKRFLLLTLSYHNRGRTAALQKGFIIPVVVSFCLRWFFAPTLTFFFPFGKQGFSERIDYLFVFFLRCSCFPLWKLLTVFFFNLKRATWMSGNFGVWRLFGRAETAQLATILPGLS